MRKVFSPVVSAVIIFIFSVTFVLATEDGSRMDSTSSGQSKKRLEMGDTRKEYRDKRQELHESFKEMREHKLEEFRQRTQELAEKFREKKEELKDKRYGKIIERLERIIGRRREALGRLETLAEKIQSRINKLKEKGVDVSAAQAALDSCGDVKNTSGDAIDDAQKGVEGIDFNATNAKEIAKAQVLAIHLSNQALRSYHRCLVEVIKSIPRSNKGGATESAE